MQPPYLHLLLFLLLLLPGTWADPDGFCKLHLFQTFIFHNTNFVDISAWATLEDIIFATLQKDTSNILYLHPWVYPALPAAEWANLQNLFSIYMHNFILSLSDDARLYQTPYPFVFQCATGCDLYPNGSYTKFYHLAYNAHDFLSFNVDNSYWERQQESELAEQVERQFNTFTGFSATLQHLLNVTCVDHMKKFIEYGRADLERQEPPMATVFTRTPSPAQLLLVCRVTGSSKVALGVSITIILLLTVTAALAGAIWHYRHRSLPRPHMSRCPYSM
ncbi:PREDICTED: antigen-presenting glycoprotein CD1d-like, partial [Cariama cristata]|uniref:antigen-presenting glycoprotein CD1d-like n=1 Tax=Cariama cristata TaxID=54380 RepID=UPI000520E415